MCGSCVLAVVCQLVDGRIARGVRPYVTWHSRVLHVVCALQYVNPPGRECVPSVADCALCGEKARFHRRFYSSVPCGVGDVVGHRYDVIDVALCCFRTMKRVFSALSAVSRPLPRALCDGQEDVLRSLRRLPILLSAPGCSRVRRVFPAVRVLLRGEFSSPSPSFFRRRFLP